MKVRKERDTIASIVFKRDRLELCFDILCLRTITLSTDGKRSTFDRWFFSSLGMFKWPILSFSPIEDRTHLSRRLENAAFLA